MEAVDDRFAFADDTIKRAGRAFSAALYEDAARDAYLSALHAAKQIVGTRTGVQPTSHSGVRKRLSALIQSGLRLDSGNVQFLKSGHRLFIGTERSLVSVSREYAADYLNRAADFLAAAKAVCR